MNKRGVALIASYMVVLVLTILGSSLITQSLSEKRSAETFAHSIRAFWVAEAGLRQGVQAFKDNNWDDWDDITGLKHFSAGLGEIGEYQIDVDGAGTNIVKIRSVACSPAGCLPSDAQSGIARRTLLVEYSRSEALFRYAAFGNRGVHLTGNARTDSYNSSIGPYGGENVFENGHVAGIGWSSFYDPDNPEYPFFAGGVFLTGSSKVLGAAEAGPHAVFSYPTWWGYDVPEDWFTGGISTIDANDLEGAYERFQEVPDELSGLSTSGSKIIKGSNSEVLGPGNYSFSKIDIGGNAQLTLQGEVNIYLTDPGEALKVAGSGRLIIDGVANIYTEGNVVVTGAGVVNNNQLPKNFMLYGTQTSTSIKIQGSGDIHGGIYAPGAKIEVTGNARLYGAAVGDEVVITGSSRIAFDEDFLTGGSGGEYSLRHWKEGSSL